MRAAVITKQFRFEAAHQLPHHRGKCARPHGHSYLLEVSLRGPVKEQPGASDHGMVLDFSALGEVVRESVVARLDHHDLNEVTGIYTTAENLVHWIWERLVEAGLPEELLWRVRLWETATSYAEIGPEERGAA